MYFSYAHVYFIFEIIKQYKKDFGDYWDNSVLSVSNNEDEIKEFLLPEDLIDEKLSKAKINPLKFSKDERTLALDFLRYTNYYSFSIYRKQLTPYKNNVPEDERYSFTDCLSLYDFDEYLRENLNRFAGIIECFMKATFVSYLCSSYNGNLKKAECYLDGSLYSSQANFLLAMRILNGVVEKNKSLSFSYHKEKRNNKFPLWVLIEELTFGEATKFISCFDKKEVIYKWILFSFLDTKDKREKIYDDNMKSSMFGWFQSAWHIRNICAHYSRIYGALFKVATPSLSAADKKDLKKNGQLKNVQNNQLFSYLLAFKNILNFHSVQIKDEWNRFIIDLENKIQTGEMIEPTKIGFIDGWQNYLSIDVEV